MPTGFDDFSPRAAADAPADAAPAANRRRLREAMEAEGFRIMPTEWWHFDAPGWEHAPVLDVPVVATPGGP
jgi:D-alanyl-D-alanine dipeptidase